MNKLGALFILLVSTTLLIAQDFQRKTGESAEDFAKTNKPADNAIISNKIIETKQWEGTKNTIIVFYTIAKIVRVEDVQWKESNVEAYIFIETEENKYKRVFIDKYAKKNNDAFIEDAFFENADKDKPAELIILCSWDQTANKNVSGKYYQTYLYDNINFDEIPNQLTALNHLNKIFVNELEGKNAEGKNCKAKYKTTTDIKEKLKKLGY